MAVAEVPRQTHRRDRVVARQIGDPFFGRADQDGAAFLEHQPIAVGQLRRVVQAEQKRLAGIVDHANAPAMTIGERQGYRAGDLRRPGSARLDRYRAPHQNRK